MENCQADGCVVGKPDFVAAGATGWEVINGELFCPDHAGPKGYVTRREAKKEKIRADLTAQRRHHEEEVARKVLSAAEYRAWDQFQSDLADFHQETGKLAPKVLREMNPGTWVQEFRQKGRIDVQKTADWYANAEKRKIERLKGLLREAEGPVRRV